MIDVELFLRKKLLLASREAVIDQANLLKPGGY
jgi:hypothetical protein